ncbi:nucleotidyltransferase domain-containing protein [Mucilaginibacter paludis]|uniref:cGAS/DncV-like nucleotidyltransferase C-terminal helical domain-containing protein n=1 Tax=Mucilaginibacter paludis DSM 18603 TaxID=714943 RepID=H1XZ58_9SPHI|nr:nucleotidyltransferase [Mucilaginibacter paludis]EHQ24643.1 hypothetical protein Mucpa_0449 [Mucilaginibacter paludis DSM 18603]
MSISENQLDTWSHQGSITNSANTANAIKDAINSYASFPTGVSFDVYLSGSYKNDTNIFGESDVDVVVELTSSFYSNLTDEQKSTFSLTGSSYRYDDFKKDVINCLEANFSKKHIEVGNKAIKVYPAHNGRLHADVLVCYSYRLYTDFTRITGYHQGVSFFRADNNAEVINFPKKHSEIDTIKHQNTNGYFKPTVRIFKNIKKTLVNDSVIEKKLAPSYFIECLLSNVPNDCYGTNYSQTVFKVLTYLQTNNWDNFRCVNGLTPLWGDTTETWELDSAKKFVSAVIAKWNKS